MTSVRRLGLLMVILLIGMYIGSLGLKAIVAISAPLVILWLLIWDDRSYRTYRKKNLIKMILEIIVPYKKQPIGCFFKTLFHFYGRES